MKNEKTPTLAELKAQYKALEEEIARQEKAEAEERKAKLAAEKEARYAEIQNVERRLIELKSAYIKDYGSYNAVRAYRGENAPSLFDYFFSEV